MKLHFEWRDNKGQYSSGESLYLNKIQVGGYGYNATRSKDSHDADDWAGYLTLPGLVNSRRTGDSQDIVKAELEKLVTAWFEEAKHNGR